MTSLALYYLCTRYTLPLNSPFQVFERAFRDTERTFRDTERTFRDTERNFILLSRH